VSNFYIKQEQAMGLTHDTWEQNEVMRLLKSQPGTQYQESNNKDRAVIRNWVSSMLQQGLVTVEFVKADGSVRQMQCTLNSRYIPISTIPAGDLYSIENNSVTLIDGINRNSTVNEDSAEPKEATAIRVYDIEAAAWRSFRYDRLRKISATVDFQ
jgi:hypothetical protein